ncbi:Wadjet anti-phage system protein JetA family protein [Salinarimonas chemoclinalis]|uniref:Wadjet anti-phage system protein JetA family protein n=1 Tax=Salinarimonas chemoclinalis TaxID=3241599 RepID=UPI0035587565
MLLFQALPVDIFRPLSNKHRLAYAQVLSRLNAGLFSIDYPDQPTKEDVVVEIQEAIVGYLRSNPELDREDFGLTPRDVYVELCATGWLQEIREAWTIFVGMDERVSRLLDRLCQLHQPSDETIGGAISTVVNGLEDAVGDPDTKSIGVQEAAKRAKQFARHMRGVIGSLKVIEQEILTEASLSGVVTRFFGDFVDRIVIRDYKTITVGGSNPFLHRHRALGLARDIVADTALFMRLCDGYVAMGVAADRAEAEATLNRHVADIEHAFAAIERFRWRLDASRSRVEQRFKNTVRYMDLLDAGKVDAFLGALSACAPLGDLDGDDEVPTTMGLVDNTTCLDDTILPEPDRRREPIATLRSRPVPPDPVWQEFERLKRAFDNRVAITPERIGNFAARALGEAGEARAGEMIVDGLEDFVLFSALQILRNWPDRMPKGFTIESLDTTTGNDWMDFGDFRIARERPRHGFE